MTHMLKYAERQSQRDARVGRVDDRTDVRLDWGGREE